MTSILRCSWTQLLLLWVLTIKVQFGSSFQVTSSFTSRPRVYSSSTTQQQPTVTKTLPSCYFYSKPRATSSTTTTTELFLSSDKQSEENGGSSSSSLPFWLDIGTKGGVVFYTTLLFVAPLLLYNVVVGTGLADEISAGRWIGVGFTVVLSLAWVSTYVFRVATKDMTYAKQLKDYENAVIAKRLEELDEDEIQALVEEVERDDF